MRTRDLYDQKMRELIKDHGWALQGVAPTVDDPEPGPTFVYTVGLTEMGAPELVIYGLPFQVAAGILNDLGARVRDGLLLTDGQVLTDALRDYDAVLVAADPKAAEMNVARSFYGKITALQLVWPDAAGRFPWDDGYAIDPAAQPVFRRS